jgi:hypothetical protein
LAFWPEVQGLLGSKDATPANAVIAPVTESVIPVTPAVTAASAAVVDTAPSGVVVVPVQSMAAASAPVPAVIPSPAASHSGAAHVR